MTTLRVPGRCARGWSWRVAEHTDAGIVTFTAGVSLQDFQLVGGNIPSEERMVYSTVTLPGALFVCMVSSFS